MKTDYKIAYSMGQFATSLNLCVETLRADPDKFDALVFAGLNCIALNQAKQAEGYFRRGLNLSVKNGELNFLLGNALFGQQRISEALQYYAKAERYGCSDES